IFVREKISRDVITVGLTMRISLLYQGEYSQWRERFMNYLEEQTDGEAMINFIQNHDQPLPIIAQVSLAGNAQNAPLTLKDLKQMRGFEYGEQDRKAIILYEYETFKANEGEQLLDTYLRYLQVINDLKKCGYKKDNYELNYKFLNNLQPKWKQYGTLMRQTKNLMDINIDALYNILKQNQGDVNDALGYKKKAVVVHSDPLALVAEKINVSKQKEKVVVSSDSEGSGTDDFSELKKITALLAKAFNRRKFYSKPTNNNLRTSSTSQSANKKQEFVKTDDKKVEKKGDEKKRYMSKVKCYNCKKEGYFTKDCKKARTKLGWSPVVILIRKSMQTWSLWHKLKRFFQNQTKVLLLLKKPLLRNRFENPIYFEKSKDLRPSLYDEKVIGLGYTPMFLTHSGEALEIKKFKRSRENKIEFSYDYGNLNASYVNEKINFEDDYFQEIINPDFEKIDSPFQQTSSLKPYVPNVILEKIIIDLEDEVVNLLEKEKVNL
nr:hypothetical protein [Tanacetum cinerariifolium]